MMQDLAHGYLLLDLKQSTPENYRFILIYFLMISINMFTYLVKR